MHGTLLVGSRNPQAKLTPDTVAEARRLHAAGADGKALAAQFGVSQPTMRHALVGITWKHVPFLYPIRRRLFGPRP